jgi:hypothetical protein
VVFVCLRALKPWVKEGGRGPRLRRVGRFGGYRKRTEAS